MSFGSFVKKNRTVIILVSLLLAYFIAGFIIFINCLPREKTLTYEQVIKKVKKDYGCEKILWMGTISGEFYGTGFIPQEEGEEITYNRGAYYVIGEKAGREMYIIVPFYNKRYDISHATWAFDYSFFNVLEKFNECGVPCVSEVTADYYSASDRYINVDVKTATINRWLINCSIGADFDTFYESLDVKAVFSYEWVEDGYKHACIVTQENGELKSYEGVREVSGN